MPTIDRDRGVRSSPRVTFVVLSYNFSRFLRECIESILAQEDAGSFELVVVDDASTDDTRAKLQAYRDERIRVKWHEKNLGHVASVNEAMAEARGEFVARIDGDDRYRPHFLRSTLPIFEKFPDVGLVYGDAALIDVRGNLTEARSDREHGGRDYKGNELVRLMEENFICSPTVIARREAWLPTLPVPGGLAFHDWYFTLMMARAHDFYYLNQVLAEYRVHPGNLHSRIVSDGSEEASIFRLLDRIFAETEKTPELEMAKRRARSRIHGAQFLTLATKYFGLGMYGEARRCYLRAIGERPAYLLRPLVLRRLAATLVGRRIYERAKALVKQQV
jgi:glycosyltransferase involved in cell wall biosynthesis